MMTERETIWGWVALMVASVCFTVLVSIGAPSCEEIGREKLEACVRAGGTYVYGTGCLR